MADNQFKRLANQGGNPRQVAEVVNRVLDGGLNSTGSVTLQTSSATTVVSDVRVGENSVITFMPKDTNAAAELTALYVSARTNGTFTITLKQKHLGKRFLGRSTLVSKNLFGNNNDSLRWREFLRVLVGEISGLIPTTP